MGLTVYIKCVTNILWHVSLTEQPTQVISVLCVGTREIEREMYGDILILWSAATNRLIYGQR